jgi:glyoxylase-like metal-dependent hydrolase (beta-lactamase superfamily II)
MKAVTHMNENAKVRLDPQESDTNHLLNWDVFVTPSIPTVWSDLPPGTKQLMWSPISSTLIYGKRDAVLVDAFITAEQAGALVDWVIASGKNLTTIYATHGHGDHFFGIGALLDRFPNARAVAYIRDFDRVAGTTMTARELYDKMLELYPDRVNPGALWFSARAVKP